MPITRAGSIRETSIPKTPFLQATEGVLQSITEAPSRITSHDAAVVPAVSARTGAAPGQGVPDMILATALLRAITTRAITTRGATADLHPLPWAGLHPVTGVVPAACVAAVQDEEACPTYNCRKERMPPIGYLLSRELEKPPRAPQSACPTANSGKHLSSAGSKIQKGQNTRLPPGTARVLPHQAAIVRSEVRATAVILPLIPGLQQAVRNLLA